MSSKGGYTAATPTLGGDRIYLPPAVRRQHQMLLQQQQMIQRQPLQQQQQLQRQVQRRTMANPISSSAAEAEKRSDANDSSMVASLSVPRSVSPASTSNVTNLDRLMESVTPSIQARYLSEVNARGCRTREADSHPFFYLEDLWESFSEWSVYGAGVPLLLNGTDPIEQYYVPFLSGIQLYIDPAKHSSCLRGPAEESDAESHRVPISVGSSDSEGDRQVKSFLNLNMQHLNRLSVGDKSVTSSSSCEDAIASSPRLPLFQFLEREQPYNRRPLADKISMLASEYPELRNCQPQFHAAANARTVHGAVDPTKEISLPVFALAAYKLKGSIVCPCGPHECEQENSLLQAAENWLRDLEVILPDYQFFRAHYSQKR